MPRAELQQAMALNGIANNGSRIAGPPLAGAIIAASGPRYVFALNAVLSLCAILLLAKWPHEPMVRTMRESRKTWLSNSLLSWSLYSDLGEQGHFVEHLLDESWAAYVRRNERVSVSYAALRERKMSFHIGPSAPVITRSTARSVSL